MKGNLWVKEIQDLAIDGITATKSAMSNHPILQRREYALSPDVIFIEETEPVFSEELDELEVAMRYNLWKLPYLSGFSVMSRLQLRWASQDVVNLDLRDEEMVINFNWEIHILKSSF